MIALFCLFLALFASPFKSKSRLEAENAALRHQLIILRRKVRGRVRLTNSDRLFFCSSSSRIDGFHQSSRPSRLSAPRPSCDGTEPASAGTGVGNPAPLEAGRKSTRSLRALIRRMSADNPLWGAPRIHGELLKVDFEVAQSSVAKYMVKRCGPPSPRMERTFLRNHAPRHRRHGFARRPGDIMPNRRGDRVLGPTLDPTKKTPRWAQARVC